jgi:hypothetical protein
LGIRQINIPTKAPVIQVARMPETMGLSSPTGGHEHERVFFGGISAPQCEQRTVWFLLSMGTTWL